MRHARLWGYGVGREHLDALEQRGHACSRLAAPKVGLDTPYWDRAVGWPPVLEEVPNSTDLRWVANLSALPVHLDVRDIVGMYVCVAQHLLEESLLGTSVQGCDGGRIWDGYM